jgi:hypothetical protein
MIGFAVSVHDKFEDLSILVDILRHNFEEDYYIAVCSTAKNAESKLKQLDIDEIIPAPDAKFEPSEGITPYVNLMYRILESLRRTCKACSEAGCDYVMHLHADAWVLEEETLQELQSELQDQDKMIAVRGPGFTYAVQSGRSGATCGHVMDQFFLYDAEKLSNIDFFEFDAMDLMPHSHIHTSLMILFLGNIQRSNMYFYSDMTDDVWWDGTEKTRPPDVRPSAYNERWGLCHVASEDFPKNYGNIFSNSTAGNVTDYGKQVQALYLDKHNISEGDAVQNLLDEHLRPKSDVLNEIAEIEKDLDRKLRRIGFDPDTFYRKFSVKHDRITQPLHKQLLMLGANIGSRIYNMTNHLFLKLPYSEHILSPENRYFEQELKNKNMHNKSKWPLSTREYYLENTEREYFGEEYDSFWFSE